MTRLLVAGLFVMASGAVTAAPPSWRQCGVYAPRVERDYQIAVLKSARGLPMREIENAENLLSQPKLSWIIGRVVGLVPAGIKRLYAPEAQQSYAVVISNLKAQLRRNDPSLAYELIETRGLYWAIAPLDPQQSVGQFRVSLRSYIADLTRELNAIDLEIDCVQGRKP